MKLYKNISILMVGLTLCSCGNDQVDKLLSSEDEESSAETLTTTQKLQFINGAYTIDLRVSGDVLDATGTTFNLQVDSVLEYPIGDVICPPRSEDDRIIPIAISRQESGADSPQTIVAGITADQTCHIQTSSVSSGESVPFTITILNSSEEAVLTGEAILTSSEQPVSIKFAYTSPTNEDDNPYDVHLLPATHVSDTDILTCEFDNEHAGNRCEVTFNQEDGINAGPVAEVWGCSLNDTVYAEYSSLKNVHTTNCHVLVPANIHAKWLVKSYCQDSDEVLKEEAGSKVKNTNVHIQGLVGCENLSDKISLPPDIFGVVP